MMKKIYGIALGLLTASGVNAQNTDSSENTDKALYVKGNALFVPLSMINLGLEYQLGKQFTVQADGFISPWKSTFGNHFQVYMGHLEGRYYFKEAFKNWYVGANVGFGVYDMTKWNYVDTGKFQRGYSYMLGATVGYQWQWKDRWNIDVYLGGGTSQGYYRGYVDVPPDGFIRYDDPEGKRQWNQSGEWIPYRGGIMIAYKIK